MFGMANSNLADIYSFLKTCTCPQLERLFVQVSIFFPLIFMKNCIRLLSLLMDI